MSWPCGQDSQPNVRMPPTAFPAPRGERRGLLVLTAGPVPTPTALLHRPGGLARTLIERAGVLALFLSARRTNRGTGRLDDHDARYTRPPSTEDRRTPPRSPVPTALASNRCPTAAGCPTSSRWTPDQRRSVRSARSSLRVLDASARLARTSLGPRKAFRRMHIRTPIRRSTQSRQCRAVEPGAGGCGRSLTPNTLGKFEQ
jgi:hypothetical protein